MWEFAYGEPVVKVCRTLIVAASNSQDIISAGTKGVSQIRIFVKIIVIDRIQQFTFVAEQHQHGVQRRAITRGIEIENQRLTCISMKSEVIVVCPGPITPLMSTGSVTAWACSNSSFGSCSETSCRVPTSKTCKTVPRSV